MGRWNGGDKSAFENHCRAGHPRGERLKMKKASALSFLVLLCALLQGVAADSKSDPVIARGMINFNGAQVSQMLEYYKMLTRMQLVTSSHVNQIRAKITMQPDVELKMSEAVALVEKVLREQAGVIITRLDEGRVSVTYNDALPITVVTDGKPVPLPLGQDGKPITPPTFPTTPAQK
jgi:hypothetical protein